MNDVDFLEEDGTILVQCWCESQDMKVPPTLFRLGQTLSCGKPECVETKVCSRCKQAFPATDEFFYRDRGYLQYICKPCKRHDVTNFRLQQRYGIDLDEYERLLASQDGGCAICGEAYCQDGRKLHVDHDHSTGEVRGLLCHRCNTAIGLLKDDPNVVTKAVAYLKSSSTVGAIP